MCFTDHLLNLNDFTLKQIITSISGGKRGFCTISMIRTSNYKFLLWNHVNRWRQFLWIVNHFKVCWDEISWVCRYVKWINKEICENWTAMNNNESTVIHVLQNKPLEIIVQNKKTSKNLLKWVTFIYMLVLVIYYQG